MFTLDFILNEIKYFQFGYCSIFHNSFHEILRNETHCGCCFIAVIWRKMKSAERKHRKFHENKDSRSKDQNKNEFHFIAHAVKTNVNRIFSSRNNISFQINFISNNFLFYTSIHFKRKPFDKWMHLDPHIRDHRKNSIEIQVNVSELNVM